MNEANWPQLHIDLPFKSEQNISTTCRHFWKTLHYLRRNLRSNTQNVGFQTGDWSAATSIACHHTGPPEDRARVAPATEQEPFSGSFQFFRVSSDWPVPQPVRLAHKGTGPECPLIGLCRTGTACSLSPALVGLVLTGQFHSLSDCPTGGQGQCPPLGLCRTGAACSLSLALVGRVLIGLPSASCLSHLHSPCLSVSRTEICNRKRNCSKCKKLCENTLLLSQTSPSHNYLNKAVQANVWMWTAVI